MRSPRDRDARGPRREKGPAGSESKSSGTCSGKQYRLEAIEVRVVGDCWSVLLEGWAQSLNTANGTCRAEHDPGLHLVMRIVESSLGKCWGAIKDAVYSTALRLL